MLSFNAFNRLQERTQLTLVLMQGTYLARRFDDKGNRFILYYMGSFFAEVYYEETVSYAHRCHTFISTAPLESYLAGIHLPIL